MKRISIIFLTMGWMALAGHAQAFTIADTPLFVTGNVAPNIILTLDDSGSMRRAYVPELPEGPCGSTVYDCGILDNRWFKAAHGNAMYYNPNVTYVAPKNADGSARTTSFTSAWRNGFTTAGTFNGVNFGTTVNLSTSYQPTASLSMAGDAISCVNNGGYLGTSSDPAECFMGHFIAGYGQKTVTGTMLGINTTGKAPYFDIPNFVNQDGSASGEDPGANLITVKVGNTTFSDDGTLNSDTCSTSNDPSTGRYRTRIIGDTLRLCFNDASSYYGATVTVTLKDTSLVQAGEPASSSGGVPAYYYVFNKNKTGCSDNVAQKQNNNCYDYVRVSATSGPGGIDERQNFANWYSFYRTRNLATISGASLAFSELDQTTRVAWQGLKTCIGSTASLVTTTCNGFTGSYGSNAINIIGNATHRQNFYNWLFKLPAYEGTPLREALIRAGNYYTHTSGSYENGPYDNDIGTPGSGAYSCRRNFHIMMTDGKWNGGGTAGGNIDKTSVTNLPDGTAYNSASAYARIFRDDASNTLADLAFKYWKTDLSGLTNNLTPVVFEEDGDGNNLKDSVQQIFWNPKNDPATWQHMVNFTIGLGLTDYLTGSGLTWTGDMYQGSYFSIRDDVTGTVKWPEAEADENGVSDLWHAAINSRGRFYSAEAPDQLVNAFQSIMAQVKAATPSAAALAANSTKAEIGTRVYQAKFDTSKWNGHLYAYDVNPADGSLSPFTWDAATAMPVHGSRNIYVRNATGGADFAWTNLTTLQQAALDAGGLGEDRVAWIRGDTSKEARFFGGVFRNREIKDFEKVKPSDPGYWLLGDIISSDPEYVGVGSQGYDQLPSGSPGQSSYAAYVSSHKASRPPAIYVGANDGMLHAFRIADGVELFAVIPDAVFANLSELTSPSYAHRFYVDGSPSSGDAYLNNGLSVSGWNTVVATGLGAGGNSIIAVDATSTTTTAASRFMWEYTETDMGFTYSQPQVVRMNDGSWAAVFGNGYKTSGGGAYLYVVNLANGTLIRKIQAGSDANNGLSTPILTDTNNDKIMDFAYAGDLQGNLWKFDLSANSAASWSLANAGTPLFIAKDASGNRQPITVQPSVAKEVAGGGYWVFFGTGRYLASEDVQTAEMSKTQSFYGIWDNGDALPSYALRSDPSYALVAQTVTHATSSNGFDVRVTSDNAVNLSSTVRGWYMDLPGSGERVVSESVTVISNVNQAENRVVFVTVLPSSDPCNSGGSSWLMEVLFSGKRPASSVFDLEGDGDFDSGDMVTVDINGTPTEVPVSGVKSTVGILDTPTWLDKDAGVAFKLAPGTSGSVVTITNKGKGGAGTTTRVFWQQLM